MYVIQYERTGDNTCKAGHLSDVTEARNKRKKHRAGGVCGTSAFIAEAAVFSRMAETCWKRRVQQ